MIAGIIPKLVLYACLISLWVAAVVWKMARGNADDPLAEYGPNPSHADCLAILDSRGFHPSCHEDS